MISLERFLLKAKYIFLRRVPSACITLLKIVLGLLELTHVAKTFSSHNPDFGNVHLVVLKHCPDDVVSILPHLLSDIQLGNLLVQIWKVLNTAPPEVLELRL